MKRTTIALAMVFSIIAAGSVAGQRPASRPFVKDEILVKFADGTSAAKRLEVVNSFRAASLEKLGDQGWQRIKLPAGVSVEAAIKQFRSLNNILAVQPNFYYKLALEPNDPQFMQGSLYGLEKISAPMAWDLSTGSHDVVVANIDTGSRFTHEDLAANMWTNPGEIPGNGIDDDQNGFVDDVYGWDFFANDSDAIDEHGHGTHTAGTIGAVGNNMLGVVGVNWNVKIMTIKIFSSTGFGTTSAMLINAYNYITMMKERGVNIRVTNNSYGGCDEACGYDQATKDAIDRMGKADILNVFAAGNSGVNIDNTPFYPASYTSPSILSVGGSTQSDARIFNFGVIGVDLAAPAVGIQSTTSATNSSYGQSSGTSMAAPHTAGAAALLAAYNPTLSAASIKATLMNTVDQLPAFDGVVRSGGRLNVDRALRNQTECSFEFPESTMFVRTRGGVFKVPYDLAPNCEFAVSTDVNWIRVMGEDRISGKGELTFRVYLNRVISRTGNLNVGGRSIEIRQTRGG